MARKRATLSKPAKADAAAKACDHQEQQAVLRRDIGLRAPFKKKKEPAALRYDRSLDRQLWWDIHADREHAEALIAENEREVSSFQFPDSGRPATTSEWQRLVRELETRNSKLETLAREWRGGYANSLWEHPAGTASEPFAADKHRQIAVKVIDGRGNELLVVKKLGEAEEQR